MINEDKVIVFDLDGTLCAEKKSDEEYIDVAPNIAVVEKLRAYHQQGFYIIINSSRQMRTYKGNLGKINANTLKIIFQWLDNHDIPYDEVHVGKPWAGRKGFYVDDRTIRPDEFVNLDYDAIKRITNIK